MLTLINILILVMKLDDVMHDYLFLSNSAGFGKDASVFDVENSILKAKEDISQLLVKIQQMD